MGIFGENHEIKSLDRSLQRLKGRIYHKLCDLEMTIYTSKEPLPYERRTEGEERKIFVGDRWGGLFDCAWFHITGTVPPEGEGKALVYIIDINGEGLIFDDDGCPYRGITNVSSDFGEPHSKPGKRVVRFSDCGKAGDKIDFWMDAGCNDLFGNYCSGTVKEAYIAECNYKLRELYYDFFVLFDLMKTTPASEPERYEIMSGLLKMRDILTNFTDDEISACFEITKALLAKKNGDSAATLTAVGNAHIDLAWLWPIRETKRKGARTFATALENMNRYDDYIFGGSQAQLFEWVKQDYPKLYDKVKSRIAEGRFEIMGAMWVESDTNVPSGESLIRQIMYGNAYYEKEFGKRCRYVWLPDTFGYTGAFPQIIKNCGIEAFLTIKISWNKYTKFPYNNFNWRGIDGTVIPTHMPPEGNYLSGATPDAIKNASRGLAAVGQFGDALLPFGIGDGGGGPSPSHIEYLNREKNLRGLPPTKQGTVAEFLDGFLKTADALPVYDGELYLECHTGTYTTMGRNKRYNRICEQKLHDAELLSALAMRLGTAEYPQAKLEEIWKEVLLYQFHDILPGSSINRVYEESQERYAVLADETDSLINSAAESLCGIIDTSALSSPAVVFNTLSFERSGWIKTGSGYSYVTVPSVGYSTADMAECGNVSSKYEGLENDILSVRLADNGDIISVYNKKLGKELLSGGSAAMLIYDDVGDAWEMEYEYLSKAPEHAVLVSSSFLREGPFSRVIRKYTYGKSTFDVVITLADNSDRLEFNVKSDWNEDGRMLRIHFEHTVKADNVDCDIQFGHISRSTKSNTEHQRAQYEVCAHRWIRAAQPGLGIAVLSECKYGFFAKGSVIEMAALRSSNFPSKHMDAGLNEFSFALFADNGANDYTQVVQAGYDFANPLIVCNTDAHSASLPASHSFIACDNPNVIIESVKKAEEGEGVVIRSYEANGAPADARIELGFDSAGRIPCNLIEQSWEQDENSYHGFEIKTVIV